MVIEALIGMLVKHSRFGKLTFAIEREVFPVFGEALHEVPERVVVTCRVWKRTAHKNEPAPGFGVAVDLGAHEVAMFTAPVLGMKVLDAFRQAVKWFRDTEQPEPEQAAPMPSKIAGSGWESWLVEQALRNAGLHAQCITCKHIRAGSEPGELPHCGAAPAGATKRNVIGDCAEHEAIGAEVMGWTR